MIEFTNLPGCQIRYCGRQILLYPILHAYLLVFFLFGNVNMMMSFIAAKELVVPY